MVELPYLRRYRPTVSKIQAVCFDISGVLAHVAFSWDSAMTAAGLPSGPSYAIPLEILPAFNLYQAGQLSIEAYLEELADFLEIDSAAALKVHNSILLRPTDGTLAIVEELNVRGFATGCLSNTNTLHWGVLTDPKRYPNVAALQVKAASQLIGHNKPAEESFRAFEAMVGFSPDAILFLEDSPANVEGAKQCGWNAVQVDPSGGQAQQVGIALAQFGVI